MAFNPRQSNVYGRPGLNPKTPGSMMKKKKQQEEHDLSLKDHEISACLTELSINLSIEDIRKPSPGKVQYLYEVFVDMLMGVRKDVVDPIVIVVNEDAEHFDLQHDAATFMAFYRSLSSLMVECQITDFSMSDLHKPEPERFRLHVSNIINFLRFRESKLEFIEEQCGKAEKAKARIEELYFENTDVAKRLEELRAQKQREEPLVKRAEKRNAELTEELLNLKTTQTKSTLRLDEARQAKKALIQNLQERSYQYQKAQQEATKLLQYIVDSPEQFNKMVKDMQATNTSQKALVENLEREQRALTTSADSFALVREEIEKCVELMEACRTEIVKEEEHERRKQRLDDKSNEIQYEIEECKREDKRLQTALETQEANLRAVRQSGEEKKQRVREKEARIEREYETLSVRRKANQESLEKKMIEIEKYERAMADMKERFEKEIRETLVEYEKLTERIGRYIGEMNQVMQEREQAENMDIEMTG